MSQISLWIHTPFAQALGWTLVHFVWEGAALAVVLMAMLRVFRAEPAQRRYTLACLVLAAMPVAFSITLAVIWARRPMAIAVPLHWVTAAASAGPLDVPASRFSWRGVLDRLAWLVPVWFAGVAFFYARGLAGWAAVRRLRRRGVLAPAAEWQKRLDELAARLRISRPVALLESCFADTPVLIGYLRPVILLPLGCLTGLSTAQVECILLHELAHVARHDYVVNLMQSLVEGLLFYHPAVWWASRVVRAERENCCDDRVVELMGNARAYAATLAALEQRRAITPEVALAATGGDLMKRIRRLTMESKGSQASVAPAFSAALLLVIFAAALTALPAKLPNVRRTRAVPATARLAGFAVAATSPQEIDAQLATPYRQWLTEDVAYILEDQERTAFLNLTTDAERENFIEQFWKRRDPTPDSQENEYREEHYRRIAYANEHFASQTNPGWKNDRGRTYIVYGPPDEIDDHPSGDGYRRPPEEGGGMADVFPFQQWRYRYIDSVGNNVIIEFIDPAMTGEYRMTTDPNEKVKTPYKQWLLQDVAYIISPEERAAFQKLTADEEREQFIHDFWQRRGSAVKDEHYRRIAYANEHFKSGIPGWKTDMGRIYIMYGPPDQISQMGAAAISWSYRHVDGVGDHIGVVFENQGGEYRLTQEPVPPKQEQAKVFASNDRMAVSVIVPDKGQGATFPGADAGARVEEAELAQRLALLRAAESDLQNESGALSGHNADLQRQLEKLRQAMPEMTSESAADALRGDRLALLQAQIERTREQYSAEVGAGIDAPSVRELREKLANLEAQLASPSAEHQRFESSTQREEELQAAIAESNRELAVQRQRQAGLEADMARMSDARQMVTVLIPVGSAREHFNVSGEVKSGNQIVQTFESSVSGQPALAKAIPLRAGTYHLTVVVKNLATGATRRSTLDFTVD